MTELGELTDDERRALVERLRQTGLRLDRDGRWWHEGAVVSHRRLARAFHRWIDRLDDGRYVLRLDERRYAYIDVEDAPFIVRSVDRSGAELELLLSDETRETLDPTTLAVGDDDALYCRVKGARFEARFSQRAQQLVADLIVEAGGSGRSHDSGYAISVGGELYAIARR